MFFVLQKICNIESLFLLLQKYSVLISFFSFPQLISGTGPDGRIRAADVESFDPSKVAAPAAAAPSMPAAPPPIPGDGYIDIPLSNMRKVSQIAAMI